MSVKHVVLGKQTDGSYGLRCSKTGYDASTNPPDQSQLSFNSEWSAIIPVYQSGTLLNLANGSTTITSYTSVGAIPLGYFNMRWNGGTTAWSTIHAPYIQGHVSLWCGCYIDHFKILNNTGYSVDISYIILRTRTL